VVDVTASAHMGETGVDEDCSLILRHENGALSTITASLRAPGTNDLTIAGTHGRLTLAAPVFRPSKARLIGVKPRKGMPGAGRFARLRESAFAQGLAQRLPGLRGGGKGLSAPYKGNGYQYQAAEVARCLATGEITSPLMPMLQSIEVMEILDQARKGFRP
jgi:predicted dehydrogenase